MFRVKWLKRLSLHKRRNILMLIWAECKLVQKYIGVSLSELLDDSLFHNSEFWRIFAAKAGDDLGGRFQRMLTFGKYYTLFLSSLMMSIQVANCFYADGDSEPNCYNNLNRDFWSPKCFSRFCNTSTPELSLNDLENFKWTLWAWILEPVWEDVLQNIINGIYKVHAVSFWQYQVHVHGVFNRKV